MAINYGIPATELPEMWFDEKKTNRLGNSFHVIGRQVIVDNRKKNIK